LVAGVRSRARLGTLSCTSMQERHALKPPQPRASGLGRVLSDPLLAGYPLENVTVLADGDATRDNLVRRAAGRCTGMLERRWKQRLSCVCRYHEFTP
jgi:hypothetical protein